MGAARTRIYIKGSGLVVDEPSYAAINRATGALLAVGAEAQRMMGRTPAHIRVVRPVGAAGINDIEMAQRMLRYLVDDRIRRAWRFNPSLRAAACVPHDAEPLAQRAMIDTLAGVGARRVLLVDTLIAGAVGCGLPVAEAEGALIAVCGAAMTQVAVLSLGNVVAAEKIPVGGEAVDRALVEYFRTHHGLFLPTTKVRAVHELLSTAVATGQRTAEIHGRDVITGLHRSVTADPVEAERAARTPMVAVFDGIRTVLRRCPPDLVADVGERGVMLAGGNAAMPGLEAMLREAAHLPVHVAEHPGVAPILGLGSLLNGGTGEFDDYVPELASQTPALDALDYDELPEQLGHDEDGVPLTPEREPSRPGWRRAARALGVGRDREGAGSR